MVKFKTFNFNQDEIKEIKNYKYGEKWPVVYFIHNDKEAYIGETTDASIRTGQHLKNSDRKKLNTIHIISDDDFNKSAIMDIESSLIRFASADGKYTLQNLNSGLQNHEYYQRSIYQEKVFEIWNKLQNKSLVNHDLNEIENSDLFKFSPYKSLTTDQYLAIDFLLDDLSKNFSIGNTFIINGSAGTGKTVLAIYLIKLIKSFEKHQYILDDEQEVGYISKIQDILKQKEKIEIGLVIPQTSLRKTLKKVFKNIDGLNGGMVIGPSDVVKKNYDILIVDEAHRLKRRLGIMGFGAFDKTTERLGLDKNDGTELDWILKSSTHQILFYDSEQSIRPSDVQKVRFDNLHENDNFHYYQLESQLRCKGGSDYVDYIKHIFSNNPPEEKQIFNNYEFFIVEDINQFDNLIKEKEIEFQLSRLVAGYAWEWLSKYDSTAFDIEIDSKKYIWNTTNEDWVNSPNAINEVGCIHTTQGYDLNYAGVIIGDDLKYDPRTQKLFIVRENYYDSKGKVSIDDNQLFEYILNIYQTLCLRAIKGTYLYVVDKNLREYLKRYVKTL